MAYRARNILIAVALAAVAALLTSFYVTSYKRHVQRGEDHVTVLVAKKDIPEGTSGADVKGLLEPLDVPRKSVVPGAISDADQLAGLVATQPTMQGEQVTTRRFNPRTQVGVRAQLSGTLRAVSLEGDQNQLLAGTLKDALPGGGEPLQQPCGMLVAAVLRPEQREDRQLEVVGLAPEQLDDARVLGVGEAERLVQRLFRDPRQGCESSHLTGQFQHTL